MLSGPILVELYSTYFFMGRFHDFAAQGRPTHVRLVTRTHSVHFGVTATYSDSLFCSTISGRVLHVRSSGTSRPTHLTIEVPVNTAEKRLPPSSVSPRPLGRLAPPLAVTLISGVRWRRRPHLRSVPPATSPPHLRMPSHLADRPTLVAVSPRY